MATGRVPTTANSPLTTKGDLFGYSTAPARLAVGADGETIVADSSTATGLRYQGNFAAGKNKIINGDFNINQRGFSTSTTNAAYNFDRFMTELSGGTVTTSAQTFTPGTAPVAGYEATNFVRVVTSGQSGASDYAIFEQRIEDVRTFAGQTVTISFWAKAATGTPSVAAEIRQSMPATNVFTAAGKTAITTSWARYSLTVAVPSLAGKTLGASSFISLNFFTSAGSDFNARTTSLGLQNVTIDFWGIQLEAGSTATAFQTATGTIQGELAACQRYYYRQGGTAVYETLGSGWVSSTTQAYGTIALPVSMRVIPTSIEYSTIAYQDNGGVFAPSAVAFSAPSRQQVSIELTCTGLTAGRGGRILTNNSTNGYLAFSAEL